jgi:GNAT superfamily N-acetyltransferase
MRSQRHGIVLAVTVRDATPADLGDIGTMIRELAVFEESAGEVAFDPDDLARHLFGPDPAAQVLLATVASDTGPGAGGEVVAGMAVSFRTFSTWVGRPGIWLEDLFVRPQYRRLGLATELLAALAARTDGRLEWQVLDWNRDAVAFYTGLGAAPVAGWTRFRLDPGWTPPGR